MAKPLINDYSVRQAAERYAAADNSDPFVIARAMAHMRNGVASYSNKDGEQAFYNADETTELRVLALPNGKTLEWQVTSYRNRFRP